MSNPDYRILWIDAIEERDAARARVRLWQRNALWYAMTYAAAAVILVEAVKWAMGYCR
jgi:hypothetical protein